LKTLYEDKLITFNGRSWEWDLEKIANFRMMGSVVDQLIEKIKHLSPECQEVCLPK
jgi:predicted ATPase